jgi:hypothetical protein
MYSEVTMSSPRRYSSLGYWTPCNITSARLWRTGCCLSDSGWCESSTLHCTATKYQSPHWNSQCWEYWNELGKIVSSRVIEEGAGGRMGYKLRRGVVWRWPFEYCKHYPSVSLPRSRKWISENSNVNIDVTCAGSNLNFFLHSFPSKESICTMNEWCCNNMAAKSDEGWEFHSPQTSSVRNKHEQQTLFRNCS